MEWILDQYKKSKAKDPTVIREKFNSYRVSNYKVQVIELIGRVTPVSVRTMAIVEEMREAQPPPELAAIIACWQTSATQPLNITY
jgi:hypothetical protein